MLTTILRTQYIKTLKKIIEVLENTSVELLTWFKNNEIKVNADKCHLLLNSKEKTYAKAKPYDTQSSEQQTLLVIFSDNKLTFDKHINYLCAKASQKRNALCRVLLFLSTNKRWLVMTASFISYHFLYCPLI